jgi:ssDNA thymidine ADP-ribosyltransferase, DarT
MPIDLENLWVYRIILLQNLEMDLKQGLLAKNNAPVDPSRVVIGNTEIITSRDQRQVKCYPDTVVNDYVPFYFSVRTPMLYNIYTGMGVRQRAQREIVYLCCRITDLAIDKFQWCFTNANAAEKISKFYNDLKHLDKLDWKSIHSTDFRLNNTDGDEDRIRKKHAEFLVKDIVPPKKIVEIAVLNNTVKEQVETIVSKRKLAVDVKVKPNFYF